MLDILEEIKKSNKEIENSKNESLDIGFNFHTSSENIKQNDKKNSLQSDSIFDSQLSMNKNLSSVDVKLNVSGLDAISYSSQVKVLLFCVDNESFKQKNKSYNLEICGKSMKNWLKNSLQEFDIKEIEFNSNEDFLSLAKQNVDEKFKYTLVLFTDTPLLQYKTIIEIIEYFILKKIDILKVTRGYMFENSYLKNIDKIYNPQMQYFEEEDFITCYNLKQYAMINDIMKNRIISYHQKQGVIICDASSTYIDADVSIESNVIIEANNKIIGNTIIEDGVKLSYNNLIENSVIMQNSKIENSVIKNSVIGKDCLVENFCVIQNKSVIGDQSKLLGYNYLDNKKVERNCVLDIFKK